MQVQHRGLLYVGYVPSQDKDFSIGMHGVNSKMLLVFTLHFATTKNSPNPYELGLCSSVGNGDFLPTDS